MPKLKIPEYEMQNRRTKAVIAEITELEAVDTKALAKILGLSASSVNRKKRHPEQFTLAEIRALVKRFKLTAEQQAKLIGVSEL
ncbi:helix-turn-helix domain-containing protein [Roseburia porci]|nr:helix-turn-helix domain-containing protein [Roseburia porci]